MSNCVSPVLSYGELHYGYEYQICKRIFLQEKDPFHVCMESGNHRSDSSCGGIFLVLSGGERTRLAMIKLLLEPVNLLILDEPTNHLDMKTKDILKQALLDFDGTLIVVSHDRDFLDGLVSKVYEFGNQKVTEHLCGIYEFLEKKKMDSLQELEKK